MLFVTCHCFINLFILVYSVFCSARPKRTLGLKHWIVSQLVRATRNSKTAISNSIKLKILDIFGPNLVKFVSKLEFKLKKWKKLELAMYSNSKLWSLMKLEFNKKWARSSTNKHWWCIGLRIILVRLWVKRFCKFSNILGLGSMGLWKSFEVGIWAWQVLANKCLEWQNFQQFLVPSLNY